MHWFPGWRRERGWLPPLQSDGTDMEPGAEATTAETVAARVQRLADLQDELVQMDRLPGLVFGTLEENVDSLVSLPSPVWHERSLQIEAEMEQLREEIAHAVAETEVAHPQASEAIGCRILQHIRTHGVPEAPAGWGAPDPGPDYETAPNS